MTRSSERRRSGGRATRCGHSPGLIGDDRYRPAGSGVTLPSRDRGRSRARRPGRRASSAAPARRLVGILAIVVALRLAGIDVLAWLEQLWAAVTDISIVYVLVGCVFQGLQTVLTALGWYGILRYAYPGGATYMEVLAACAVGSR